jgi:hypothetical protein
MNNRVAAQKGPSGFKYLFYSGPGKHGLNIKLLLCIGLFNLTVLWPAASFAQASSEGQDQVYGLDPLLYNGRIYYFFPQPGTVGTQYLNRDFDRQCEITLRGVTYRNLEANFDILNQELILKYKNALGATNLIALSRAWLEAFELGGCHFETLTLKDTTKRIYQVLGSGTEKILYYRSKELLVDNFKTTGNRYFSDARKEMSVSTGNGIQGFRNNRGFVRAFDALRQDRIKKYLRKQKINVKTADDKVMTELINYCFTTTGS